MASVVNGFAILGIDGHVVNIEVESVTIVGLGDIAVKAAIIHAKYEFPKLKMVINLVPNVRY